MEKLRAYILILFAFFAVTAYAQLEEKTHETFFDTNKHNLINIEDAKLQKFYKTLWVSEAKHGHIFVKMALNYFDKDQVYSRLEWWVTQEAEVLDSLEIRSALH